MESFHRTHPRFSPRDKYTIAFPFSLFSFFLRIMYVRTHTRTYIHVYTLFSGSTISVGNIQKNPRFEKNLAERGENIGIVRRSVFGVLKRVRGKGAQPFICLVALWRVKRAGCAPWHTLTVSTNFTPNFQLARTPADLHNILEIFYKISSLRRSHGLTRARFRTPL